MHLKQTLALVSLGLGVSQAFALEYPNFTDVSGLTLNGSATQIGNELQLTPPAESQSGTVFSTTTVPLNNQVSFSTRFQFRITDSGGFGDLDGLGADGLAFVVQTDANNVGGAGGGIGYAGIFPSVAVEFDTYNNDIVDDFDGNHVGISLNGNVDAVAQASVLPRFNNGNVWTAWVDYNGLTDLLEVRVDESGIRPVLPNLSYSVDLESVLGQSDAFVGFSAGTGGAWGDQRVLNWVMEDDFHPVGSVSVPDGGSTALMLGLGALGLGVIRKRNK